MNKKSTLFFLFFLIAMGSYAQKQGQARLDSLLAELPKHIVEDSNKVRTLSRIGIEYYQIDPPEGIRYANMVLELSQKINYKAGLGNAYSILSCCYGAMSNIPVSVDYGLKCLKIVEEVKDNDGVLKAYMMIGSAYSSQKEFDKAIEYYEQGLEFAKAHGEPINRLISNLGSIYSNKGDLKKALEYSQLDVELSRKDGNKKDITNAIGNLGGIYVKTGNISTGIDLIRQSLQLSKEEGFKTFEAYAYRYLGRAHLALANDSNAVQLKDLYNGNRNMVLELAHSYVDTAMVMANASGGLGHKAECYRMFSEVEKLQGNYKASLESYEKYIQYKDSIFNKEKTNKITQISMQHEFDKKEAAEKAKHEREVAMAHAEVQKQRVMRNSSIAGTCGVLLFMGFSFYNYKRQRQLERLQALSTERLRISRELHDDVGSALGSIALYSDVAISRSLKKESTSDVLLKIGNASRELVEKMSDIIWSMNPDNENTDKLVSRMKGFASSLLTPLKANIHYEFDPSLNKLFLSGDRMKNIFLIYKEAIYNIAKYAECRNVDIVLSTDGGKMFLTIKDDGKGFETTLAKDVYNGNGLNNMKARTVLLNGTINIQSSPGTGTRIELTAPVAG